MRNHTKPLVLAVGGKPEDRAFYEATLNQNFHVEILSSGDEALDAIERLKPEVIILALEGNSGASCYDICSALRNKPLQEYIGIVIVTSEDNAQVADTIQAAGADAFTTRSSLAMSLKALVNSARRARNTVREWDNVQGKLQQANDRLKILCQTDELTGLYNMRFLARQIRSEFKRAERYFKPLSMIMLDIDELKRVNDAYDHLVGSSIIAQMGQEIRDSIRVDIDYAARHGGDEFIIILPETDLPGALIVAERLRKRVASRPYAYGQHSVQITLSLGVATFESTPKNMQSFDELTQTADGSLALAKEQGRNRVASLQQTLASQKSAS